MTLSTVSVSTPKYVLMDDDGRIGPHLVPSPGGHTCLAVYGFSGKAFYDRFISASSLSLTPYPLVRGDLRNQLELAGNELALVVVDAAGPDEPVLEAALMQAVLLAQESKAMQVTAQHRLVLEPSTKAYRAPKADPQES